MRPKKTRWVKCEPGEKCFRPQCTPLNRLKGVYLTLDEFEAIRLADFKRLKQEEAASRMKISRPTFSRIISSAHGKIGDALVSVKAIRIEGGCCKVTKKRSMKGRG